MVGKTKNPLILLYIPIRPFQINLYLQRIVFLFVQIVQDAENIANKHKRRLPLSFKELQTLSSKNVQESSPFKVTRRKVWLEADFRPRWALNLLKCNKRLLLNNGFLVKVVRWLFLYLWGHPCTCQSRLDLRLTCLSSPTNERKCLSKQNLFFLMFIT